MPVDYDRRLVQPYKDELKKLRERLQEAESIIVRLADLGLDDHDHFARSDLRLAARKWLEGKEE